MTNTASAKTISYEGGSARALQIADLDSRGAVAVFEWVTYRGETLYFAANVQGAHFLRISTHRSETAARKAANSEFKAQRRAMQAAA